MTPELPKTIAANIEHFTGRTWLLPHLVKWLDQTHDRFFILKGEPGTGKSMLMAWLAGAGPLPVDPQAKSELERIGAQVKAAHFCIATGGSTAPKAFAQNMAEQLTRNVSGFNEAILATLGNRVEISVDQRARTIEAGGSMTGVIINRLDLGELGDEVSFDRTLREPLKKLYEGGYNEPILLLVDALDEAITYTGRVDIVRLLAKLTDLSEKIRILVTTRPDPRVLKHYPGVNPFDLIDDAPANEDDVSLYARERLATLKGQPHADLAQRIGQASHGIFLYAHLVLNDMLPRVSQGYDVNTIKLPDHLNGLYQEFLNRELGLNEERWSEMFKPVLGLIAVAQGEGLNGLQLEKIIGQEVEYALRVCKQYLDGDLPHGPFRPFHKSFADFLLEEKQNEHYHIDAARMHQRVANYYWALKNGAAPWRKWDEYGLRYTATHLAEAAQGSDQPEQHEQTERLVKLAVNRDFQQTYKDRVKDLAALQRDLEQALHRAATDADPQACVLVVESALALVAFRRNELRPEPLFDLARQGDVESAERRLSLFDVDTDWQQAALLTIAWLAADKNSDQARQWRDRLKDSLPVSDVLTRLLQRLNATLDDEPMPALNLPPPPPPELVRAIVSRIGAEGGNAELLNVELLATRGLGIIVPEGEIVGTAGYLAEHDGPPLVSFAAAFPYEGDQYFKQYLSTHTAYSYVQYRNRSLWFLLKAVLQHPDQDWVRMRASELAVAALAGNTLEFHESLPLTILALQAGAGKPDARHALDANRDQVLTEADRLGSERGQGDTWGRYKRRLAALAQAFSLVLNQPADAVMLLDRALHLPYGFAGFQSPSCLALAEVIRICQPPNETAIKQTLQAALEAAHNIQDAAFCARSTARFNALNRSWWSPSVFDVRVTAQRLCEDASVPEFAAVHQVGETYPHRSEGPHMTPLPEWLRQANTLAALAPAFQRPLADFQRLNREQGWAADEPLPAGTFVRVPDPGLATWLAARVAAEAFVDASLSDPERATLIQSLVPLAAANATALDTVLARLLLAARPTDPAVLDELEQLARRNLAESAPADLEPGHEFLGFVP